MNNQYRIKLEINLKYRDNGINQNNYILVIKVLKKDNRFNVPADRTGKGEYSACTFTNNYFSIISNNKYYKGLLEYECFYIPNKKFLNRNLELGFMTDSYRKEYLRKMYKSLLEWSSVWGSFKGEPPSNFKSIGNKWYIYITN
jgi:hypothetical protein